MRVVEYIENEKFTGIPENGSQYITKSAQNDDRPEVCRYSQLYLKRTPSGVFQSVCFNGVSALSKIAVVEPSGAEIQNITSNIELLWLGELRMHLE